MAKFNFTLYLDRPLTLSDEELDRLYEAGCDDGAPGTTKGVGHVDFTREADSLEDAIRSAIANVRTAGFAAVRVETSESQTVEKLNRQLASA